MSRTTKTITISIPQDMDAEIAKVMKEEGRTRSELLREALRRYMEDREWRRLQRYAQQKAREAGIETEEQVAEIIHARRVEGRSA